MAKLSPEMAAPSGGGEFELCPEGVFQAVLCDIKDEGYKENKFYDPTAEKPGEPIVPKVRFIYQVNEDMSDGRPFLIFGRPLTVPRTLENDRSNLRLEMIDLVGKKRFDEILAEIKAGNFDIDDLIGTNCRINVVHATSKDGKSTFANIDGMFVWTAKDGPLLEVRDYTRHQDRHNVQMPNPSAWESRDTALLKVMSDGEEPAPAPTPAAAPAPAPAAPVAATPPPAPAPAAGLSPGEIAEFQAYFDATFNPAFAAKKLEEFTYQMIKQKDWTLLKPHQLAAVKFQMNNLDTKYWAAKPLPRTEKPDLDALEELGEDPFENE